MEDVICENCGRAVHPYRDTEDGKCPLCRKEHAAISEYRKTQAARCLAYWASHCLWAKGHSLNLFKIESEESRQISDSLIKLQVYEKPFDILMQHLDEFSAEELEYLMDNLPSSWFRSKVHERLEEVLDKCVASDTKES